MPSLFWIMPQKENSSGKFVAGSDKSRVLLVMKVVHAETFSKSRKEKLTSSRK